MNISGRMNRLDIPVRTYHVAEILAGMTEVAAIGLTTDAQSNAATETD